MITTNDEYVKAYEDLAQFEAWLKPGRKAA
jgi:hypothetical protein